MKIINISCFEGNKVDMRQANAVLKYNPDIIIREVPNNSKKPGLIFNKYPANKKPVNELEKIKNDLKKVSKKYPYVLSDVYMFENLKKLWLSGYDVKIYDVDAPSELLHESVKNKWSKKNKPHRRGTHLVWWAYIYVRELIMTKYTKEILTKNKDEKGLTVLVFIQKFHWLNIKFQMSHSKTEIWNYYFGKFNSLTSKEIKKLLKKENAVLYKYWKKLVS
jgi:hypothetical protein